MDTNNLPNQSSQAPQPNPSVTPQLNQPPIPVSNIESNPDLKQQQPKSGSKSILLTLISLLVLAIIVGVTLYLYISNRQAKTLTNTIPTTKAAPSPIPINAAPQVPNPTTIIDPTIVAIQKKYNGVLCKRHTSVEEALKEIEIACVLDLSGQNLTALPDNILKLTEITNIDLSNNNIKSFPSELLELKKLVNLNLSNNNISSIPSTTNIPRTIQSLLLTGNNLSKEVMNKFQRFPGTPAVTPTTLTPTISN